MSCQATVSMPDDRGGQPIAVIGMGCRLPGGVETPDQLWQLLVEGRDTIIEIPNERWLLERHFEPDPMQPLAQYVRHGGFIEGIDQFDPTFFGITAREAVCMDPQQRLLLESCWRAFEDSGQSLDQLRGQSIGVFMGLSSSDYISLLWASEQDYVFPDNEPFVLAGNTGCIAANRISYAFDFKGPSFTVDTACSSSLVAVHLACQSLQRGECRAALAGGAQVLLHPGVQMSFCKAGLLSPDGRCKSFDAAANGYVRSEGAGVVLLKRLEDALHDGDPVQAVIRGSAVNSDGRSNGLSAPNRRAQIACMREAYFKAGVDPSSVLYVEAHGTGTRLGDPVELRAIGAVLGCGRSSDFPCRVGSVKSNLGHSETAAGITGFIKSVLCLKHRQLPASLHCKTPNPSIDFEQLRLHVQRNLEPFPCTGWPAVLGVSSFGFGGTNAHVVLEEAIAFDSASPDTDSDVVPPLHLLCLTAHSPEALKLLALAYAEMLREYPLVPLNDICATTHRERSFFRHRLVLLATTRQELLDQLEDCDHAVWHGEVKEEAFNRPLPDDLLTVQLGVSGTDGYERLQAFAKAVGAGYRCDWNFFHSPFPHQRCWLPRHPFIRQRYWWSKATDDSRNGRLWREHLGFSSDGETCPGALLSLDLPGEVGYFQTCLSCDDPVDLGGHRLHGSCVFPAAGYLQFAIELQRSSLMATAPFIVSELRVDSSLSLTADPSQLQVVLEDQDVRFFARSKDDQSWERLASAGLRLPDVATYVSQITELAYLGSLNPSVVNASEQGLHAISIGAFYQALERVGFNYGASYQSISRLWAKSGEAWAELERPEGAPDRCMLDGCLQSLAAALSPSLSLGDMYVPVGLALTQIHQWPLPNRFSCVCRLRTQTGTSQSNLEADLVLLDRDGGVLGNLDGVRLRRMHQSEPAAYVTRWSSLTFSGSHQVGDNQEQSSRDPSLREWLLEQPSLGEHVCWPDLDAHPLDEVCSYLLTRLQERPPFLWLVLEGDGPKSEALDALLRSAAAELPLCRFTTLKLPPCPDQHPQPRDWPALQAAAEHHGLLRWCDGEIQIPHLETLMPRRFRIGTDGSGRLEGLKPFSLSKPILQPNELELAVEATGLNFRDVLNALGLLNQHLAELGFSHPNELPFGGECVGRVVDVGPGVDPSLIGQRVIAALAVGSLASHVVTQAALCKPLSKGLSVSDGAGLSTAFLTAIYGLEHLAGLKAGETVLIHAAAGGVGQAALQVALRCGARIFATASNAKQQSLLQQGVEAVFDSRTLAFSDQILELTGGRGVDVVLNSLKGDWVDASFRCLAHGGRFVELGKIEIWTAEQAQQRRPDAQYLPFDLIKIAEREPHLVEQLLTQLLVDVEEGVFTPLPTTVMPLDSAEAAFRLMAQARHVGKVVITQPQPLRIRADATYVVSGAFGGIGRQLLPWLVERGARSLLLIGRQMNNLDGAALDLLSKLRDAGASCTTLACDLGSGDEGVLCQALNALPVDQPVRGVFHAAGVLGDGPVDDLDSAQLRAVITPKFQGWIALEQACQQSSSNTLEFVVGFSSVAALFGSPGQVAYSAANGAMEGLCQEDFTQIRRLAIQWGPWAGEGMAAGLDQRFSSLGISMLRPAAALSQLGMLLERGQSGVVAVLDNDWNRLCDQSTLRQRHWFRLLVGELSGHQADDPYIARETLRALLQPLSQEQRHDLLMTQLAQRLSLVMECEPSSLLERRRSLFELGLDSLMAVEFTALVQAELGLDLDLRGFSDDPTLFALARLGLEQLFGQDASASERLDLAEEARLPCDWHCPPVDSTRSPGTAILLTGATGYLGAYLLAGQLQRWPDLHVRCLVRAPSEAEGLRRIRENLDRYHLWQTGWESRIVVVPGDLAEPNFGLDSDRFRQLAHGLAGILHNGAQLSQMAPYAQLAGPNVGGTRTVLNLATCGEPVRVELISSVAVFEADAYRNRVLLETDSLDEWEGIHLGYSQTKWVSEQLVQAAGQAGLPVVVYRPPLIGGHSRSGLWHEGDLLQRLLQGALALGMAPDLAWELDAVPVDYVADAVSALAWSETATGRCFHLQHPQPIMLSDLVKRLSAEGASLEVVPMSEWLAAIDREPANPLHSLRAFFQQRWGRDGLTYPELNRVGYRARPSAALTTDILADLGVHCPTFDALVGPWADSLLGGSPRLGDGTD